MSLNGHHLLITGGTGSFGQRFVSLILQRYPDVERLVVFSRDELKQFEMANRYSHAKYPQLRFFIGDVRDRERLKRSFEGIDVVIHAAAMKQVPTAEYNPFECIQTNVVGAQNLIEAALDSGVKRVVALSTDKAAAPVNLYGATKLCSDKLFISANNIRGKRDLRFSVVRYGNVLGSRGSVIPFFLEEAKKGVLPITHPGMTRFSITLTEGVEMVVFALEHALGGEVFVPKIPSYRIVDVAEAIGPSCEQQIVGVRPGEKLHEEMITPSDALNTIESERCFVIVPALFLRSPEALRKQFVQHYQAEPVAEDFWYTSAKNDRWLSVEEIRRLIRENVDQSFSPR